MSYYPPIPIKFILTGEHHLGIEFVAAGRRLAMRLRDRMRRGGLPDGYDGEVEESFDAGTIGPEKHTGGYGTVVINAQIIFEVTYVYIHAEPVKKQQERKSKRCPQEFPCFILARIEKVSCRDSDISIGFQCDTETKARAGGRFWYDIAFCYKDKYVLLTDYMVTSAGWGVYEKGQYVLLGPAAIYDENDDYYCCSSKKSLAGEVLKPASEKMRIGYLDVYPVHILGAMSLLGVIYD